MPVYEYQCPRCERIVERRSSYDKVDTTIVLCGDCDSAVPMRRTFSVPAIQFRGKGFYSTGG